MPKITLELEEAYNDAVPLLCQNCGADLRYKMVFVGVGYAYLEPLVFCEECVEDEE
jgi:hypothetical protein